MPPPQIDYERFAADADSSAVQSVKGWTWPNERRFNTWFTRHAFEGSGDVVDLGCMSGSSTIALADGLSRNARAQGRKVHAYDQFIKSWDAIPGEPLEQVPTGSDFYDVFLANTAPWREWIVPHRERISDDTAWTGGEIELLVVDLMKSFPTTGTVVTCFYPALAAGRSHVVHQDFIFYGTPWIHLLHHRLRHRFDPVFEIPDSCSYVFRLADRPTADELEAAVDFSGITPDEIEAAFDYCQGLVTKNSAAPLKAAKAMAYYHAARLYRRRKASPLGFQDWMERARAALAAIDESLRPHRDYVRAAKEIAQATLQAMEGGIRRPMGRPTRRNDRGAPGG